VAAQLTWAQRQLEAPFMNFQPGGVQELHEVSLNAARGTRNQGIPYSTHPFVYDRSGGHQQHDRAMQFNAVVETNMAAVRLWQSVGFKVLATVPDAFDHPEHGFVGLHIMYRALP
jgi:hypothetical protein